MPRHNFVCRHCGRHFENVVVPAAIGATRGAPMCPECCTATDWIPAIGAVDAREPFQAFEAYDGQNRRVTVDSLRTLRRIERESEQQARNGEGQQIVFRRWSQGDSNKDVGTLGSWKGPAETPDPEAVKRLRPTAQTEAAADGASYGPGVNDSNTSALGGL